MQLFRIFRAKTLALLAFGLIFAAVGYAAASANTIAQTRAGDGQGSLISYMLDTTTSPNAPTGLHVTLDGNGDPANILKVRFTLLNSGGATLPQTVRAAFLASNGTTMLGSWYSNCADQGGGTWECQPSGTLARVQTGMRLRVVAIQ
jgi:hypothetical protein